MNRRIFLNRLLGRGSTIIFGALFAPNFSHAFPLRKELRSLPAFLDTLLPKYETSPSASEIGVDLRLIQHANDIQNYPRLLELGCQWLDTRAKFNGAKSFWQASQTLRDQIVSQAEAEKSDSVPVLFFERIRSDAFNLFYSDSRSWTFLGISAAPQPIGYLDHSNPPRIKA